MLPYRTGLGRRFFTPDNGGTGGGTPASSGSSAAGAGGTTPTGGNGGTPVVTLQPEPPNIFEGVELDQLDEGVRAVLEKAQAAIKTTHSAAVTYQQQATQNATLARNFQSTADKLQAKLKTAEPPVEDPFDKETRVFLKSQGYSDEMIEKNATVLGGLIKHLTATVIQPGIGRELAPMAGAVVSQAATQAFLNAQATDPTGAMHIPEVAQAVWNIVSEQAGAGSQMNEAAILNLAKMHAFDHYQAHGYPTSGVPPTRIAPVAPQPAPIPTLSSGGLTYPGAAHYARPPVPNQPTDVRMNDETKAALTATFAALGRSSNGIVPKEYGGTGKAVRK